MTKNTTLHYTVNVDNIDDYIAMKPFLKGTKYCTKSMKNLE